MWISKRKWMQVQKRLEDCEEEIRKNRNYTDRQIYEMAKKILGQPEELSREIREQESFEKFINDFIN